MGVQWVRNTSSPTHFAIANEVKGIVAPSEDEQERLVRKVLSQANVDPESVAFFEAHGTGTAKGDPIEATAIHRVFDKSLSSSDPLHIGSVKANIGHLENASGIVSVIKAALMLEKGFIVPNADFERANPAIPLDDWNMKVSFSSRQQSSALMRVVLTIHSDPPAPAPASSEQELRVREQLRLQWLEWTRYSRTYPFLKREVRFRHNQWKRTPQEQALVCAQRQR